MWNFLKRLWLDDSGQGVDPISTILGIGASIIPGVKNRNNTNQINQLDWLEQFLIPFLIQSGGIPFEQGQAFLTNMVNNPGGFTSPQDDVFRRLLGLNEGTQGRINTAMNIPPPPGVNQLQNTGSAILNERGETANTQFNNDRGRDIIQSARDQFFRTSPGLTNIVNQGGQTAQSRQAGDAFLNIINSRGQTPETQQLFQRGNAILDSGGMTPALQQLMGMFQSQLQSGGMTPEMRTVYEALLPIIQNGGAGGAVLPDSVVQSFALDQAAQSARNAQESIRRQAFQRGGGPGTVVSSGLENQALAEAADEIARQRSTALANATLAQQAARLQQLGIATSGTTSILGNATQLLTSANAGLGDIARSLSANLATGASLATDSQSLANQLFGTASQGFGTNFANENQRFGTAGNLLNQSQANLTDAERLGTDILRDSDRTVLARLGLGGDFLNQGLDQQRNFQNLNLDALRLALGTEFGALNTAADVANTGAANRMQAGDTLFRGGVDLIGQLVNAGQSRGQTLAPNQNIYNQPGALQRLAGGITNATIGGRSLSLRDIFGDMFRPKSSSGSGDSSGMGW